MLKDLIQKSLVWRFEDSVTPSLCSRKTGYSLLDEILPDGGWPQNGLTEIITEKIGIGSLRLVLPSIVEATKKRKKVICVDPPYIPYPPSLHFEGLDLSNFLIIQPSRKIHSREREILKIYEDSLKLGKCSIALIWLSKMSFKDSRRLQLAALSGKTLCVIFRPADAAFYSSSSPLRISLKVSSVNSGVRNSTVRILKAHRGIKASSVSLKI